MKPRSAFLLFVLLVLGLSLTVPAEDLTETAYDESEALPYEISAMFYIAVPQTVAKALATPRAAVLRVGSLRTLKEQCRGDSVTILDHSLRC